MGPRGCPRVSPPHTCGSAAHDAAAEDRLFFLALSDQTQRQALGGRVASRSPNTPQGSGDHLTLEGNGGTESRECREDSLEAAMAGRPPSPADDRVQLLDHMTPESSELRPGPHGGDEQLE